VRRPSSPGVLRPRRVALVVVLAGVAAIAASTSVDASVGARSTASKPRPASCVVPGLRTPPDCYEPSFPVRAAFYYPWFPQAWRQKGLEPFTHFTPSLGLYSSSDASVVRRHLADFTYAGIQAGLASWWGRGTPTDRVFPSLLAITNRLRSRVRWAVYYEPEGQGDPSVARLVADLGYIRSRYARNRAYLRVQSRFVVFVYADLADGEGMAARWRQANAAIGNAAYIDLKVFPGYRSSPNQPQAWHQYSPALAEDARAGWSFAVSPGFFKASESTPRLDRDLARWTTNVSDMVASRAPWQLITSFNEWGEGTAVEPATQWSTPSGYGAYLDVLHEIR